MQISRRLLSLFLPVYCTCNYVLLVVLSKGVIGISVVIVVSFVLKVSLE